MRRFYVLVIILMITSLACGLFSTATPNPTATSFPMEVTSTQKPMATSTKQPVVIQSPAVQVTYSPTQEEPTKTPYPTSVLDSSLSSEIKLIQSQVVEERQLQPKQPVSIVLLTRDQVRQNVISEYQTDYTDEEAADDLYEYTSTGLLEPEFDFRGFMINLLSEQIAGQYDPEMKEMFVVEDQGFLGPERVTYSHEYTHALQDQNYDIEHGLKMDDDDCEANYDRCEAVLSLLEGDATLSMAYWFQYYATKTDQQQYIDYGNSLKMPVYDSAPAFLKDDFDFPYTQGFTFVQTIHDEGGWDAVDAIYHDPPASTEQILHPSLYPSHAPIPMSLPDLTSSLGNGWREVTHNTMGEWYTYLILARGANADARLEDSTAQAAAAGWGGDAFLVLHNDNTNSTALVLKTKWDTTNDATEFSTAFQKYANIRFGVKSAQQGDILSWTYSGGYSSFYYSGDTTLWIIAPDEATAQTIYNSVQP